MHLAQPKRRDGVAVHRQCSRCEATGCESIDVRRLTRCRRLASLRCLLWVKLRSPCAQLGSPLYPPINRHRYRASACLKWQEAEAAGPYGYWPVGQIVQTHDTRPSAAGSSLPIAAACATRTQATMIIPLRIFEICPTRLTPAVLPFAGPRRIWGKLPAEAVRSDPSNWKRATRDRVYARVQYTSALRQDARRGHNLRRRLAQRL